MRSSRVWSALVVGVIIGALVAPFGPAGTATAATLQPSGLVTGFQIDGDKTGGAPPATFDWNSFLSAPAPDGSFTFTPTGAYTTAAGLPSTGVLNATFAWDNGTLGAACSGQDASGSPGSQTPNTIPWAPGPANVNDKGNLCSTASAYEVVTDATGRRHAILYNYWTRLVGNGDMSALQLLEGPAAGRCDDVLVEFDYASSSSTMTAVFRRWAPTANDGCANPNGAGQWLPTGQAVDFSWAVGVRTEGPLPVGNQPQATFGEFAVDLTTAGLFNPDTCTTFAVSTMLSRTGNDFTAQTEDYHAADDPLTLSNCGSLTVTKDVVPAGYQSADRFPYLVDRTSGGIVLPDADATQISDDLGIGETDSFSNVLAAADYRLAETVAPPWTLQSIVCTTRLPGTNQPVVRVLSSLADTFAVYPDTTTDCVLTNATSTVTVTKQTLPDGSPQQFDFTIGGNPATLSDGESATFAFAPGSTVEILETFVDGWVRQPDIVCTDGGAVINEPDGYAQVTTVAGADVQCTFTNTQLGNISISKEAIGTDPNTAFEFTGTWPGGESFSINTEVGDGTNYYQNFTGILPGHYTVSETGDRHDTLIGSLICTIGGVDTVFPPGTTSAEFDLAPGDTVTCYFVNVVPGHILVVKETDPFEYNQDFPFAFTPADQSIDPQQFTLNPLPGQATWDSPNLPGGTYDISENLAGVDGWTLTDITCDVSDGGTSSIDLDTLTATVELPDAGIAQCVFHNTADAASLELAKTALGVADGTPWSFDFLLTDTLSGASRTVTVTSDAPSAGLSDLVPGTPYSLTEVAQTGWAGTLECSVTDDDPETAGWQFTLTPGAGVGCTAENAATPASVSVTKSVDGVTDDYEWSFPFALTPTDGVTPAGGIQSLTGTGNASDTAVWTGLLPGETYTIAEQSVPGWIPGELVCAGVEDTNADPLAVTFVAQPAQALECAITNQPAPIDITIAKTALGGDGTFQFVLTPIDPPAEAVVGSTATQGGQGTVTFDGLTPRGLYSLAELDMDGWIEGALECTVTHADGESEALDVTGFRVEPGDQIGCAVENLAVGRIVVVKNVDGTDGVFDFTGTWLDSGEFTIDTTEGTGSATFDDVVPGSYEVSETAPDGYDNTELVCVDGDAEGTASVVDDLVGTVNVDPGETVVCTFTNTQWGSLIIDKSTLPAGSPQEFGFEWGPDGEEFALTDAADPYSTGLIAPGSYTVTETSELERWLLDDIECIGSDTDPVTEGASVTIGVPLQTTVYCTFVNAFLAPLEIAKAVTSGPTKSADGTVAISYEITVTNPGALADTYDLDDELRFGDGVAVVTAAVTSADGVPVNAGWDGVSDTVVATAVTIDPGITHTFEVSATARVATTVTAEQADCTTTSDAEGTGLLNAATVTFTGGDASATACAPAPLPPVPPLPPLPPTGMTLGGLWLGVALLGSGVALATVRRRRYPRTASEA
ncbi:hypothetical protein [Microbacterium sp. NPDC058389]|uniref:prealbumin-like fold domain-containing protein n=1 Tax=Microbacterium sp. NPDC058389 TaxID=3346475 RepID=UPI00364C0DC8